MLIDLNCFLRWAMWPMCLLFKTLALNLGGAASTSVGFFFKKTHSMVGRNEHSLMLHHMTEKRAKLRLASALVRYLYAYGPRTSNSMVPYLSVIFCSTVLGNKEKGVDSQTKKIDSWNSSNSNSKNLIVRKMFF